MGEATFSSNATFTVNTVGTITAKGAWDTGDRIIVAYRGKVPGDAGSEPASYNFTAQASSFGGSDNFPMADGADVYLTHTIGPNRAADGSGTLAIEPKTANAGEAVNLKLTYTATGTMDDGSIIEVTVPAGWPDLAEPSVTIGTDGTVATLRVTERTMTATSVDDMTTGSKIVFNVTGAATPADRAKVISLPRSRNLTVRYRVFRQGKSRRCSHQHFERGCRDCHAYEV